VTTRDPLVEAILRRIDEAPGLRLVRVKCTSTAPFQVEINGQGPVGALTVAGSTFALSDLGYALWAPPLPPMCFKVT